MFIASTQMSLSSDLLHYNRLYAYPNIPEISDTPIIILDSGAFALSMRKGYMDAEYIEKLAAHYQGYDHLDNIYCVAPDVFKNPYISMKQYKDFVEKYTINAVPVLQFSSPQPDLFKVKKQIDFYHRLNEDIKMMCLSNHKFNPVKQYKELQFIVNIIRETFNENILIHVLGAGYNHLDVLDWLKIGVDSLDSISYYTDAQQHQKWVKGSYKVEHSDLPFKDLALLNLKIANQEKYL